ncbi:hypothetical protein ACNO5E_14280 [Vibrio parahaemolyticus]
MGVHFGTSYVAICPDSAENCILTMADHYPTYQDPNIYKPTLGVEMHSRGRVTTHESQSEATHHIKQHIFKWTGPEILTKSAEMEGLKLKIEELRLSIQFGEHAQRDSLKKEMTAFKNKVDELNSRIKHLKALRRQKIELTFLKS